MCLNGRLSLTLAILKPDLMARPTDAAVSACTRRIAAESGQAWLRLSILRTDREIIRPNREYIDTALFPDRYNDGR